MYDEEECDDEKEKIIDKPELPRNTNDLDHIDHDKEKYDSKEESKS
jgi:hypothetical protein